MEWSNGDYLLSDDKRRLDLDGICRLLNDTYWAAGRPRNMIEKGIEHSVCLGLFHVGAQVGFCRAVTDYATFTWLCDVVIEPAHRGKGLGKWMVQCLIEHPLLQTRSQVLATRDAHTLYERWGFERTEYMKRMPGVRPQTQTHQGSCC
jgi:GNAT superfamily N-acetyltransferase